MTTARVAAIAEVTEAVAAGLAAGAAPTPRLQGAAGVPGAPCGVAVEAAGREDPREAAVEVAVVGTRAEGC